MLKRLGIAAKNDPCSKGKIKAAPAWENGVTPWLRRAKSRLACGETERAVGLSPLWAQPKASGGLRQFAPIGGEGHEQREWSGGCYKKHLNPLHRSQNSSAVPLPNAYPRKFHFRGAQRGGIASMGQPATASSRGRASTTTWVVIPAKAGNQLAKPTCVIKPNDTSWHRWCQLGTALRRYDVLKKKLKGKVLI